ncbi:MAG TPA: 30S ribosomal protein S12 methylthiotransferase RimO [Thermoanaerobaculia bacterium]|jgi:ribosomal protein S12 methylthiotransferase|nr:30S ribosomal protein S12 methylthiotransferase RimO [Thermoanaerobaculia bacterium]
MTTKSLPTVGVVSLGCPKNLVDTEVMLGHLKKAGHEIVPDGEARVVLVNTCGFIDRAKEESVEAILEQVERKKRGEIDRVVVAGCMVQKYGRDLAREIPEVDAFVGLDELENAPAAAAGLPSLPRFTDKPLATRLYDDLAPRVLSRHRGYAYLKVGEGCDNPCTFCTIPQMRGLQRSRTVASLVAEAQGLEAQGVSELVLISQDTTRYGEDLGAGRDGLARLVEALLAATAFPWIRFLYAYPKTLDDSVLELMARKPRFVPYVDIPLQHVARPILSAMRRGGDAASSLRMVRRMREIVPDIAIRTTFIVGFPGEGEEEFRTLAEFVREAELDNVGAFTYSPEPGSGSEPLGDPVPAAEKERRRDFLLSLQQPISRGKLRALRGKTVEAMVEGPSEETEYLLEGRLRSQAPEIDGRLLITDTGDRELAPGQIVTVRVEKTFDYDVAGSVVS